MLMYCSLGVLIVVSLSLLELGCYWSTSMRHSSTLPTTPVVPWAEGDNFNIIEAFADFLEHIDFLNF